MSEIKREYINLLSEHSKLEKESRKILKELGELFSDLPKISKSQRCNELEDKHDKILLESDNIYEKYWDLIKAQKPEIHRRAYLGRLMNERRDALFEAEDELNNKLSKETFKKPGYRIQELTEIGEETKRADKKLRKLTGKKEPQKSNSQTKTVLYFGSILAMSFAYLMSKK